MDNMYENVEYPELYNRIYPKVNDSINRYYSNMSPETLPAEAEREKMIDEICDEVIRECPEIGEDRDEMKYVRSEGVSSQQRPFYGRRRLLRDITGIILLSELFRRRSPRYGYPGYGYQGYGYRGYSYPGYGYSGYGYGY